MGVSKTWLSKIKTAISNRLDLAVVMNSGEMAGVDPGGWWRSGRTHVCILAFEVATIMSKLVNLWRSTSDARLMQLHRESIALPGVRKLVSDDSAFLLILACAEMADAVRAAAESIAAVARRCADPELRSFGGAFAEFAATGRDPHRWVMGWREMEGKARKMERYVATTAALYKEMEGAAEAEQLLRRLLAGRKVMEAAEARQQLLVRWEEVKFLRNVSLWGCTHDSAVLLLARAAFTVFARVMAAFGLGHGRGKRRPPAVHPSETGTGEGERKRIGILEISAAMLEPPATTLGASGLALHYANVITSVGRLAKAPRAVGADSRDGLYDMLPASVRGRLRARLRGGGGLAVDAGLAAEWREAMRRIMEWLGPLVDNTIRWEGERSIEQWRRRSVARPLPSLMPRSGSGSGAGGGVLLLQTLYFANTEMVEAAITEMLVGLNYVCRFESAKNSH